MASITLAGTLLDPNGDLAVGDQIRFTHRTTTGQTIASAVSIITVNPTGTYTLPLQYGLVLVEYKDVRSSQFKNLGVATVNSTNTATSIPELLNALVPVSSAELIEFQAILADAVAAKVAAEAAAATLDLINDLSQAYEFSTVAAYKAFAPAFPVNKVVHLKDRNARFIVISGTATGNDRNIIASSQNSFSIELPVVNPLDIRSIGATGVDNEELHGLLTTAIAAGFTSIYVPNPSWRTFTALNAAGITFIGNNSVYTGTSINGAILEGIKVKNLNRTCNVLSNPQAITGSVTPKLLFRRSSTTTALITRDSTDKEYIYHVIAQTSDSTPAQSVGAPFELMRSQKKFRCNACIVYRKDYDASVGTITLLSVNLDAYFGSGSERLDQGNSSSTPMDAWVLGQNESITYTFQGRKFYDKAYKMSVLAYTTSGSSEAVQIYVNDELVTTYDAIADTKGNSIKRIEFDVPMRTSSGDIDVRIVNASSSGARSTYVVGMNMVDLKDLQPESGHDAFMFWYDLTNAYLSTNGANDYAYQDTATGLFAGSYHGGETSTYLRFNIDGSRLTTTSLPVLGFKTGKSVSIVQRTSINSQFTTYLSTNFDVDGVEVFKAQFKGSSVSVNTFYTNLCSTDDAFDYIISPGDFALSATENIIGLNRDANEVIQYNSSTTQYVRHTFTKFDNSKNLYGGPYIWNRVGTYRKLYYGPVVNNSGEISDFEFEYQREFGFAKY